MRNQIPLGMVFYYGGRSVNITYLIGCDTVEQPIIHRKFLSFFEHVVSTKRAPFSEFTHRCVEMLREAGTVIDCTHYPDKAIYPNAVCIDSPTTPVVPVPSPQINQPQCEPMKHKFCGEMYNTTVIPNLIGQYSQVGVLIS